MAGLRLGASGFFVRTLVFARLFVQLDVACMARQLEEGFERSRPHSRNIRLEDR